MADRTENERKLPKAVRNHGLETMRPRPGEKKRAFHAPLPLKIRAMEPKVTVMSIELQEGRRPSMPEIPPSRRRRRAGRDGDSAPKPPARARPPLTAAQARALRAMAAAPDAPLRGVSWTTARALRSFGLCELGPGRRGRLTGDGHAALDALASGAAPATAVDATPDLAK